MKLSTLWLHEWVHFPLSAQGLANQLTMLGLEVDSVHPVAGEFSQVVVAQVLSTRPHPDADKLTLCEVSVNKEESLKVVCGAANVRAGLKVALAMVGACLPGGLQIKESKLRGELSQGMLCSTAELGLEDLSEGIMELDPEAPVGVDLREYLALDDQVLDIDLTPNRADCLSVLGLAREVAVKNKLPLLESAILPTVPLIDDVLSVHLQDPSACPRYCGRIIRGINKEAITPVWMSERLRRSGIRTLHPVVDVMNYVMLELGQPLHAFDLAKLKGDIRVRFSKKSESLELLDGQCITLSEKALVIADEANPLALAGIMGGAPSAIQASTQDLFLESAYFNPLILAGVARTYGLSSEAAQRYERGVDPDLQRKALERATALILSIVGGQAGPVIESCVTEHLPLKAEFFFDTHQVEQLTGIRLSLEEMRDLLEGLGIAVLGEKQGILQVRIPSHRFDLQQGVDLVEEIMRLYGYDRLIGQPIHALMQAGKRSARASLPKELAFWFRDRGYHETISYSFVDPMLQKAIYPQQECLQLLNPISSELSQMRVGMWPGLLASMMYNVHRQQNAIRLFEIGVVFQMHQGHLSEQVCIAGLLTGEQGSFNWAEPTRFFDFFDLKGDLQSLFSLLKLEKVEFAPCSQDALHPGLSAQIIINNQTAGYLGVLHPGLMDKLDLEQEVILFEMNLEALENIVPIGYKPLSKYPQIRRDLSFLVDNSISALQIEQVLSACVKEDWLRSFHVFDVYIGKGIPEGKKSLAVAMVLQDNNRTLVDSEINLLISAIIKALQKEFSIILRE